MNREASHLATKRVLLELYKVECFYRKKGGAKELLTKEKKGLFRPRQLLLE